MNKGSLFIFPAASGPGKPSPARALVERLPDLAFSVSHTTRAPRPGEEHGVHYYFVSPQQFDEMVAADRFLEHARVFGNSYGTSRAVIENLLRQGKSVIFDIDWQGARAIQEKKPAGGGIFFLPPPPAGRGTRQRRAAGRGGEGPGVIARRRRGAVSEMSHYKEFDHLVVNDDFNA